MTGCGGVSREQVLSNTASATIVPAFERLAASTGALAQSTEALCNSPDAESLVLAKSALADARYDWSFSQPMWEGPVNDLRLWNRIDWVIDAEDIEELIADESKPLDYERISSRIGADERGLGAVEYILESPDATENLRGRRCQYLTLTSQVIADSAARADTAWRVGLDGAEAHFKDFSSQDNNALSGVINDSLFLLEAITDAELGKALGVTNTNATADLSVIVEGESGLAAQDIQAHIAGLNALFFPSQKPNQPDNGLGQLLNDDLAKRFKHELSNAILATDKLTSPLVSQITTDPDQVSKARDAIKVVQTTLATEVVSNLGVTIGFSDADGDSS